MRVVYTTGECRRTNVVNYMRTINVTVFVYSCLVRSFVELSSRNV